VKLDPHLSPLREEMTSITTSTPISKISFDLYSDAVDRDPNVKGFSDTVDWNDDIKGFQGQVVSAVMNRKEWSVYWKIAHEAPAYLHDHNNICTYKEIVNQTQGGNTYLTLYVAMLSSDQGSR
jgi:hypothetical protein